MNWMKKRLPALLLLLALCVSICGCSFLDDLTGRVPDSDLGAPKEEQEQNSADLSVGGYASIEGIPDYAGEPYVVLNENQPLFEEADLTTDSYELYSELDTLGRCGMTVACVGKDIMPTEDRESISSVTPSGWVNQKYDSELVEGGWIYNRCHLIGFQLTAENANKKNLITGTRYLNIEGMLPFENMVADYVKETNNHVLYRVTPMYAGDNLVASGVRMEGYSVEDNGEEICFHIFAYNVQPGITINYATGENWLNSEYVPPVETPEEPDAPDLPDGSTAATYVLNTSSRKIHLPDCTYAKNIKAENREETSKSKETLLQEGYSACGTCNP